MNRRILIFGLAILSVIIFISVIKTNTNQPKGQSKQNTIFEAAKSSEKEKREIVENAAKYQPQKTAKTKENGLDLDAQSAILVDQKTNEVLYQKNPDAKLSPASITKIATISVVLENMKKDDLITISQKAADQEPNKIVMKAGEKLKVDDLLYGLMMISANDAALALAEAIPGGFDEFINKMNEKVRKLGLTNTNFKNPSGLDDENHLSTAWDVATLTRYALLEHPEVINYAGKKEEHSVYPSENNESHWWGHISGMLYRYPGMIAAKTGYTDIAKSTFIGVAERDGRRLVIVFLGSNDANGDVTKLLDFGFAN